MTLPPLDKYKCFHPVSLLSTTSKIGFYIVLSLKLAPIGSKPCLHFSTSTNYSISIYNLYNDLYSLTKIQPTLKGYQGWTLFLKSSIYRYHEPCLHFSTSTNYSISIYNLCNDLYILTKIQPTLKGYQGWTLFLKSSICQYHFMCHC